MNTFGTDAIRQALKHARRHVGFFAILLFALLLTTYKLTESPLTGYDEGILNQMAMNLVRHGAISLREDPQTLSSGAYMTTAYPVLFPVAIMMSVIGTSFEATRYTMALFLLSFLTAFYVVSHRTFGKRAATAATALMATHASLYAYGKGMMGEIPGLMYAMLFLIGLERLSRRPANPLPYVIATAAALGLTAVTKPVFLMILPAAGLTLLIHQKQLPITWKTITAAAMTVTACFVLWLATQFSPTDDRDSVLLFYRNPYLLEDVPGTILANLKRFITEGTPMYLVGLLGVWTTSLALRWKARKKTDEQTRIQPVETCAWLFVVLILIAYLRTPGFYRYFFLANAVLLLALPSAIGDLLGRFADRFRTVNPATASRDATTGIVLLLIAFQGWHLLTRSFITTTYGSTQTAQMHAYFTNTFDRTRTPYLYDVPEIAIFLPTDRYSQFIEVSGGGRFATGYPLTDAFQRKEQTIILNEKIHSSQPTLFTDYEEIGRVSRYVILGRRME